MNRNTYYSYIEDKLHVLAARIESNGKLNMLHLHMHSENFYMHFLNLLYGYKLENLNTFLQNVEAIDLIDHENKIITQVSSTATKSKIESALEKEIIREFQHYMFIFLSISKDTSSLKKKSFNNPYGISFSPPSNILDKNTILNKILAADITTQKEVYRFIKKELGNEVDVVKLDSNLAMIINILAKEEWSPEYQSDPIYKFEIDRKISHNQLNKAKDLIEEYCIYHGKVDSKYSEFDSFGSNKSNSVLATIKREYIKVNVRSITEEEKVANDIERFRDTMIEVAQTSTNNGVRAMANRYLPNLDRMVDEAKEQAQDQEEENEIEI